MHAKKRKKKIVGGGAVGKTAVMALMKRGGEVRTAVLPNLKGETLQAEVLKHVEYDSRLYTDSALQYRALSWYYTHEFVDHTVEYVRDSVHTNGLENFWSLLNRCIKGTHVSVEPIHLFRYVDAEAFRFNHRKLTDGERLLQAVKGIEGKRLTYAALTGATEFHPTSRENGAENDSLPN